MRKVPTSRKFKLKIHSQSYLFKSRVLSLRICCEALVTLDIVFVKALVPHLEAAGSAGCTVVLFSVVTVVEEAI